jgi:hypothetical protein
MDLMTAVGRADHFEIAQALVRGIGFGLAMTTLPALPALLLYREVGAPVVILALVPAIARSNWTANAYFRHSGSVAELFCRACPFICAAVALWWRLPPAGGGSSARCCWRIRRTNLEPAACTQFNTAVRLTAGASQRSNGRTGMKSGGGLSKCRQVLVKDRLADRLPHGLFVDVPILLRPVTKKGSAAAPKCTIKR